MNISSIPSSLSISQSQFQTDRKQRFDDFKALSNALQSGDLSAAQKAFSKFKDDLQSLSPTASNQKNSGIGQDFQSLESALGGGDINAAQTAFAKLQQDLGAQASGHAHRHHGHHGSTPSASGSSSSNSAIFPGAGLNVQA